MKRKSQKRDVRKQRRLRKHKKQFCNHDQKQEAVNCPVYEQFMYNKREISN